MADRWVVVGAGSAGCVVAARLSENADCDVLLLEAGPDLAPTNVPEAIAGADFLQALEVADRSMDGLLASRVAGGTRLPYRRGRGVGGSSNVNAMVALRGDPAVYERWGWSDAAAAWSKVAVPMEEPEVDELGAVDLALLASHPDARPAALTRRGGRRITSAEAYLWPGWDRPNLSVRAETTVERIVFDRRRAIGVVLADGEQVAADRVVLSAGSIHSPTILLRSGADTAGIGSGLQDHPSVAFSLQLRAGAHAAPGSLVIGSLASRDGLQFLPMNHVGEAAAGFGVLLAAVMAPRSRAGAVRLDAADPLGHPVVDFELLDDPADAVALRRAVVEARQILSSSAFVDIVERVYIDDTGSTIDALADDGAIDRWIGSAVGDYVHASSTCAMGTVVDDSGCLIGYEDLYVCDASVFPTIPDVNTHMPTTMLAERLVARWSRRFVHETKAVAKER